MRTRNSTTNTWIAVLIISLGFPPIAAAQTGTYMTQTLTVSEAATATLSVQVPAPKLYDPAHPTVTEIWLEFGSDQVPTPLAAGALGSVSFVLAKGGVTLPFTIGSVGLDNSATFALKRVQFDHPDAVTSPGLYRVLITHGADVTVTENWTLTLSGLPTGGTPKARTLAFVAQGLFTNLNPVAPCGTGGGGGTVGGGPFYQFPDWIYWFEFVPIPPIPPPCEFCPDPWKKRAPDDYERVPVLFAPLDRSGNILGKGRANLISLQITGGGKTVGPVVDQLNGQYLQVVEFPRGTRPTATITAGGVTSRAFRIEPPGSADARLYRNLLLGTLLLLAGTSAMGVRARRRALASANR